MHETQLAESEASRASRLERLRYFEPELELLGLGLKDVPSLDDKALRHAFRQQSRVLHPDANDGEADAEARIYETNQAYETLRKLLV